jgi:hypothetical protein
MPFDPVQSSSQFPLGEVQSHSAGWAGGWMEHGCANADMPIGQLRVEVEVQCMALLVLTGKSGTLVKCGPLENSSSGRFDLAR